MIFQRKHKLLVTLSHYITIFTKLSKTSILSLTIIGNLFFISFISKTQAARNNFLLQTARMKSTAGAGIASFLVDESTLLNPAPLAFFNVSSVYYSSTSAKSDQFKKMGNWAVGASDTSTATKGSFSYFNASIDNEKQKQWAIAFASPMGKKSSIGFSYKRNKITNNTGDTIVSFFSVGFLHVISENFVLGLLFDDPSHNSDNTKIMTGFQYMLRGAINFMFDFGANFRKDVNKTFVYRTAIQIKLLSNFYLRYGIAKDDFLLTKTNGVGIGWVGPKLNMDISLQNVNDRSEQNNNFKETSFAVSYKF